jgi:predicted RNase H-like HicB family nuclease/post-segregation antitoxin (ccd killing protein)
MARYFGLLTKDCDSAFGVHFPDLPGCAAAGATESEAMSNAAIALRLWSEDVDVMPSASDLPALMQNAEVRADIASGSAVVAIDLITAQRKQRINISIEPDLIEAADDAAKAAGLNRSQLIETALTRLLGDRAVDLRPAKPKAREKA